MIIMSEQNSNIAKALVQFNLKLGRINKDGSNPYFKSGYTTLDNMLDHVRPLLAEQGISIMQFPGTHERGVTVTTMLLHESGEYVHGEPYLMEVAKKDPQAIGSATTYAKRYSLGATLGISTGDVDDDGNKATFGSDTPKQQPTPPKQQEAPKTMSEKQFGLLKIKVKELQKKHNISEDEGIAMLFGKPATWDKIQLLTGTQASTYIKKASDLVAG